MTDHGEAPGRLALGRRRPIPEPDLGVDAVEDNSDLVRARPSLDEAGLELVRHGDGLVGEAQNPLLDPRQYPRDKPGPEQRLSQFRARLVHVREDTTAQKLR